MVRCQHRRYPRPDNGLQPGDHLRDPAPRGHLLRQDRRQVADDHEADAAEVNSARAAAATAAGCGERKYLKKFKGG